MKFPSLLCTAAMVLVGTAFAGGDAWSSDFEAAKKQAAESKKDLLIDFTGSDWCGWCIKLQKEVFSQDAFNQGIKDSLVLVEIDFPQDEAKITKETKEQNRKLGEQYGIEGYPSIVLCDASGLPYAKTGYKKGGPEKYVEHLNTLRTQKTTRDTALAKAKDAKGLDQAKALIAALDAMKLEDTMVTHFYGDIISQIKAADPSDETGFSRKLDVKKRASDLEGQLQACAEKGDWDGVLTLADSNLKEGGLDEETTFNLQMARVMVFAQQSKFDDALKAIDEVKAKNPNHPAMSQIDAFRKKIEQDQAAKSKTPTKSTPE